MQKRVYLKMVILQLPGLCTKDSYSIEPFPFAIPPQPLSGRNPGKFRQPKHICLK